MPSLLFAGSEILKICNYKKQIDSGIKAFITEINALNFGRTVLSCQGHFVRKKKECPFIYYKKTEKYFIATPLDSQLIPSFVIYKFSTQSIRDNFLKFFFYHCQVVFCNFRVYITSSDMIEKDRYNIRPLSIVLCYFSDYYVSLAFFYGMYNYYNYKKVRLEFNQYLKKVRVEFFKNFILLLKLFNIERITLSNNFKFPEKDVYYIFNDNRQ